MSAPWALRPRRLRVIATATAYPSRTLQRESYHNAFWRMTWTNFAILPAHNSGIRRFQMATSCRNSPYSGCESSFTE